MPLILCGSPIISPKQLNYDRNSITGFLLYTMFLWSGSCPSIKEADTSLGTELSWPFISSPSPSHINQWNTVFSPFLHRRKEGSVCWLGVAQRPGLQRFWAVTKLVVARRKSWIGLPSSASSYPLITACIHPFSSPFRWFPCGPPFDLSAGMSPSS